MAFVHLRDFGASPGTRETNTFADLIQTVLASVATSAAVERLFSVTCVLKTAKRSRLSPKNFLEYNDD